MSAKKKYPPPLSEDQFREFFKTATIVEAETAEVKKAASGVDRVLKAIGEIMMPDMKDWADHVFVSDQSSVGDFFRNQEDVTKLAKKLGVNVTRETYIKDLAITM